MGSECSKIKVAAIYTGALEIRGGVMHSSEAQCRDSDVVGSFRRLKDSWEEYGCTGDTRCLFRLKGDIDPTQVWVCKDSYGKKLGWKNCVSSWLQLKLCLGDGRRKNFKQCSLWSGQG